MKKKSKRYLQRKADEQWRIDVRKKWGNRCAICQLTDCKLDCHHIVSKSILELRHDIHNGILLCSGHHIFNRKMSAHKGSLLFIDWFRNNYPIEYNHLIRVLDTIK